MKIAYTEKKQEYFYNLHAHTGLGSLGDAFGDPELWISSLAKREIKHHFVTDHGTLTAIPWMYDEGKKHDVTIHPGMEGYIIPEYDGYKKNGKTVRYKFRHIVLIPYNDIGWKNLIKINNTAWRLGKFINKGRFSYDTLFENNAGLFCLSACMGGIFAKPYASCYLGGNPNVVIPTLAEADVDVKNTLRKFLNVFEDRLYIELMVNHYRYQKEINFHLVKWVKKYGVNVVFTTDCHYPEPEHMQYREAIREFKYKSSSSDVSRDTDEDNSGKNTEYADLYLRSIVDVYAVWKELGFGDVISSTMLKKAIDNTYKITERCTFELDRSLKLPEFDVSTHVLYPDAEKFCETNKYTLDDKESLFLYLIRCGYEKNLSKKWPAKTWRRLLKGKKSVDKIKCKYLRRIWEEYSVIKDAGFIDYFLIVEDIVRFCTITLGRLYGKGRGSVAGSAISWCLGITRDDPLKYGLYFERFMNPGRVKGELPDIDMDFPSTAREEVKAYVTERYGTDKVTNIGNIGLIKIKSAIQKMASVQDFVIDGNVYDFHLIQQITHKIPQAIAGGVPIETLEDAINVCSKNPDNLFYKFYLKHREWLEDKVKFVLKHPASYGKHAAGVIISPNPIDECIPIRVETIDDVDVTVSQWRDKDLLSQGYMKLDMLGLKTLDQIEYAQKLIKKNHGIEAPDVGDIDRDDKQTHRMIRRGDTFGVFQLSSKMFQVYLKELKCNSFEHIYTATALLRPGPLGADAHTRYIELEHGKAEPTYIHEKMVGALEKTNGLVIFQEDVLQLCVDIAGFNLTEADTFRSVVGKKKRDKMPEQRKKFIRGAIAGGIKKKIAKRIFKEIETFSSYGFNRAHAVSYSGLSMYQAWLKCHYPMEYWASKLQFGSDNEEHDESVWKFRSKMLKDGIRFAHINVNTCSDKTRILNDKIHWRLDLIKGVGTAAAWLIGRCAPFDNIKDFINKVQDSKYLHNTDGKRARCPVTKRTVVALINAGSFDFTTQSRFDSALEYLKIYHGKNKFETIKQYIEDKNMDPQELKEKVSGAIYGDVIWAKSLTDTYGIMALQHDVLKFVDKPYWKIFKERNIKDIKPGIVASNLNKMRVNADVHAYGVLKIRVVTTKAKSKMLVGSVDEYDGNIDFVIFPSDLRPHMLKLYDGMYVHLVGSIMLDQYSNSKKVKGKNIEPIEKPELEPF